MHQPHINKIWFRYIGDRNGEVVYCIVGARIYFTQISGKYYLSIRDCGDMVKVIAADQKITDWRKYEWVNIQIENKFVDGSQSSLLFNATYKDPTVTNWKEVDAPSEIITTLTSYSPKEPKRTNILNE